MTKKYKVSHITDKYQIHNKLYNPLEHNRQKPYPTHIKTFTLLRQWTQAKHQSAGRLFYR